MHVGAEAQVADGSTVGPRVVLGSGSRVEAGAEVRDSVLLDRCVVGEGAKVIGSILSDGVEVSPGASLNEAVIGADVTVPA
jgi:NDP-sugar pyrophosphorylase family protein